jgi:hypothetical protein
MKGIAHYYELVMSFIFGATRSKERFSDRDGLLSYATEWHAAIIGLGAGLGLGVPGVAAVAATALGLQIGKRISTRKAIEELQKEPWYGIGGSVIGFGIHRLAGFSLLDVLQFFPF